jgi:hypothetical protein
MKKGLWFILDERKETKITTVRKNVYNGFGRIMDVPVRIEQDSFCSDFKSSDLGDLFISMGEALKHENKYIKNLELESRLGHTPCGKGMQFFVKLQFDEVEEELK